jgi:hypothetical protein
VVAAAKASKESPAPRATKKHRWKFFRAGGVDQVQISSADDLGSLGDLDQKLWVVLAMPTRNVELDPKTLDLVDTDKDGRIRVPEIRTAVAWACETWKDPADLFAQTDRVPLAKLADGPALDAAKKMLANLGRKDAADVTLADVTEAAARLASLPLNGDGIVPADSTDDLVLRSAIEDILKTTGGVTDKSGKPGVDRPSVEKFFAEARAYADWAARPPEAPFGDETDAAAAALLAVRAKIDDFFTRCRLAAFDPRAQHALAAADADLAALSARELAPGSPEVARLPLAKIAAGAALELGAELNPAWQAPIANLRARCKLGAKLTEADWAALQAKLAAHLGWAAEKPATKAGSLGEGRLKTLLDEDVKTRLLALVDADGAEIIQVTGIVLVEKVVRFARDLVRVLRNFVSFSEFYGERNGAFQAGTLFIDGRSCDLCFQVVDAGKHAALAALASTFLAYCDCTRPGGEKMTIAAALTGGDSDNLMVGRNGVFYDRKGRDWDATITRLVANPISIREAFFAPYKKFVRMIEEQFAKRATAADAAVNQRMATAAETAANADKLAAEATGADGAPTAPPPPPIPAPAPAPPGRRIDVGTVAAIGVAIGGIGAMVAGILSAFFGLGGWMPIGLLAVVLMISGPSMALAYLKLRQRNLGPILDASGWAINGRARVNVPFGGVLTDLATLPPNAERSLRDPYAERRRPWKRYVILIVVIGLGVAWYVGRLDGFLPGPAKSTSVLGRYAPAAHTATSASTPK